VTSLPSTGSIANQQQGVLKQTRTGVLTHHVEGTSKGALKRTLVIGPNTYPFYIRGEGSMTLGSSQFAHDDVVSLVDFPTTSQLVTTEQRRRFELLRLAFFVLKLRRFTQTHEGNEDTTQEYALRSSLLRHAIFQQVVTLTHLDAREQAIQLINTCRR